MSWAVLPGLWAWLWLRFVSDTSFRPHFSRRRTGALEKEIRQRQRAFLQSEAKHRTLLGRTWNRECSSRTMNCVSWPSTRISAAAWVCEKPTSSAKPTLRSFPRTWPTRLLQDDRQVLAEGRSVEREEQTGKGPAKAIFRAIRSPVKDDAGQVAGVLEFSGT